MSLSSLWETWPTKAACASEEKGTEIRRRKTTEEKGEKKEKNKSLGGRKNSWVPAVPKSMDMERVGFLEIVTKETANQAEHPAFLPESRLAFLFFSQEEECTLSYGSESPPPPARNPFCLTHSHPDANAKEERCYKERLQGFLLQTGTATV